MSELPYETEALPEDDGVLGPDDSLETDDLSRDPLDTGLAVPDKWSVAERFGSTLSESRAGEPLDRRLAAEEPEAGAEEDPNPDQTWPSDTPCAPRAGRLVAYDEGSHPTTESEVLAFDVGIDAGAASAEEAAVHLVPDTDDEDQDWEN